MLRRAADEGDDVERKRPRRSLSRRLALRLASPDDNDDDEDDDGSGSEGEGASAGRPGALGSQVAELARSGRSKLVSSQH